MIPDGEKIISNYLRSHPDIEALGVRVVGKTPNTLEDPWVRVTQLDAPSDQHPEHLIGFYFQLDCYAGATGGQPEANQLARTVRALLAAIAGGSHSDGVVSGAQINGDARIPDTDLEPARERRVITTTVWMHS